jgi:uncharacterized membrane protein
MLKKAMRLTRNKDSDFRLADVAQQVVGGFLLAGPFVVTEEVWVLADDMGAANAVLTALVVAGIGYGALYQADTGRDAEDETGVAGVPVRFVTLMSVAFGSVTVLALLFDAPDTFVEESSTVASAAVTFKAVTVGAVFSVVGAATADSVF